MWKGSHNMKETRDAETQRLDPDCEIRVRLLCERVKLPIPLSDLYEKVKGKGSQWLCGLRHAMFLTAQILGSWVQMPPRR
jgi:hypothetical protein